MRTPIFRFWLWLLKKLSGLLLKMVRAFDFFKVKVELKIVPLRLDFVKIDFDFEIFFQSRFWLWKSWNLSTCYILSYMVLCIRQLRRKMPYKNRRFGLISLEKMTIKSVGEHIETLINISTVMAYLISW
jgi:hypothetical protein